MTRHLLVTCCSRAAVLQLDMLDTADWSAHNLAAIPLPEITGGGDAAPMAMLGDRLWLAWRGKPESLLTFEINRQARALRPLGSFPLAASLPHLSLGEGRLLGAGGDEAFVFHLDANGVPTGIACRATVGRGAHCIMASAGTVLVAACAKDRLSRFTLEGDRLVPRDTLALPPGSGPRHIAFGPHDMAHVLTEHGGEVISVRLGARMEIAQRLPFANASGTRPAEILLGPAGDALFVSLRAESLLVRLPLTPSGLPRIGTSVNTAEHPRSFCLDPQGAFVAVAGFHGGRLTIHSLEEQMPKRAELSTAERPSWVVSTLLD